ncbi:unnamed protein product [Auanema sp. JU1783]|nr:unnamed protein product [Auanema sp. JU1783]
MYGILVIGAPGAGKSTFCTGLSDIFSQLKREFCIFNLDPANDNNEYDAHFDIKELITVEEVMERLELGPNGALKYCIETLCRNPEWLIEKILANKQKYIIIDCPGQLELYKSEGELWRVIRKLESAGVRLCALHLADSLYCSDASKFISVVMSTLSTMVTLEMPQVNVLSKIDLFDRNASFNLEYFLQLPDISKLLEMLNDVPGLDRYQALNNAICQVISDFDLVNFLPLDVRKKESMAQIIKAIDTANGYALVEQEGDIRDMVLTQSTHES